MMWRINVLLVRRDNLLDTTFRPSLRPSVTLGVVFADTLKSSCHVIENGQNVRGHRVDELSILSIYSLTHDHSR